MNILTALVQQLQREDLSHFEPKAKRLPSDEFIAVVRCDESRKLYRAWRKAHENHLANINRCKEDVLSGKHPRFDVKKLMLDEAKVDCLSRLLLVSLLADYPQCLLELESEMVLCEGWELILRRKDISEDEDCGQPDCPVHGTLGRLDNKLPPTAVWGVKRKGEC